MTKEQEDSLLEDPKASEGYVKITIRDCIRRRFAKVVTPTWVALSRLENGEISKGKALQIIQEEAERLERESWEEQSQYADDLERRLTAAQRENDLLRSEVAELKADAEKYRRRGTLIGRILHRAYETKSYKDKGHVCDNRQTVESIVQMIEAHLDDMRARAATEEGKRG